MIDPILGLYSWETLSDKTVPSAEELIDTARRLNIQSLMIDFPELHPQAEDIGKSLRALLPKLGESMRIMISVSPASCKSSDDLYAETDKKLAFLGITKAEWLWFGPISMRLFARLEQIGFSSLIEEMKASGKARYIGLWISDRGEYINDAASAFPSLDGVRFDYMPLDIIDRPGYFGFRTAQQQGLSAFCSAVHIGERRETRYPPILETVWRGRTADSNLSSLLLRWSVMLQSDQQLILFPASPEELEKQIQLIHAAEGEKMSMRDKILLNDLRDVCRQAQPVPCTACGCCMPCPYGVDIPGLMAVYIDACVFGEDTSAAALNDLLQNYEVQCRACGKCVKICPRSNPVPEILETMKSWT